MTVKEIFEPIMVSENVEIIDQKDYFRYWNGQGKDIPLRYCDLEVKHIYSGIHEDGGSKLVIAIIA